MGRSVRGGDYVVDTTVEGGRAWWALVAPDGSVSSGTAEIRESPSPDSTGAEAAGILGAVGKVPRGGRLVTDALQLVRAVRGGRAGEVHGAAGEIMAALRAREVTLVWARRSHRRVRAAHRAAQAARRAGRG